MSENEIQTVAEETPAEITSEAPQTVETAAVEEAAAETPAEETPAAETTETVEAEAVEPEEEAEPEEISYHAVEKEGEITAIWEMQGQKHLRTIDPRSTEGQKIFSLFTSDIHETDSPPLATQATS